MVEIGENWKCPYCNHAQVIAKERYHSGLARFYVEGWAEGLPGYSFEAIVCANADCGKLSLTFAVVQRGDHPTGSGFKILVTT